MIDEKTGVSSGSGWRSVRMALAIAGVVLAMSGCGIFGCGGAASNGGGFGGCVAGTRF